MISGTGLASARISGLIGHGFHHFAGEHPGLGQPRKISAPTMASARVRAGVSAA
jgi:hypothetical protein